MKYLEFTKRFNSWQKIKVSFFLGEAGALRKKKMKGKAQESGWSI